MHAWDGSMGGGNPALLVLHWIQAITMQHMYPPRIGYKSSDALHAMTSPRNRLRAEVFLPYAKQLHILPRGLPSVVAFKIWGSFNNLPTHFVNVSLYVSDTTAWRSGALCASGLSFTSGDSRIPITVSCAQSTTGAKYISLVRWVPGGIAAANVATRLTVAEVQPFRQGMRTCANHVCMFGGPQA